MWRKIFFIIVFAVAMGLLEAVVVVYLRWLYYPEGFEFPLRMLPWKAASIELIREACTLIMLVSVGWLTGKNFHQRLAFFLLAFATWDIVYYLGLKIFLNWPPSLLTWDLLFLIPVAWVAPVLAPVISALTMIILSAIILYNDSISPNAKIYWKPWMLIVLGAFLQFVSFIWDYTEMITKNGFLKEVLHLYRNQMFMNLVLNYKPIFFHWDIFLIGGLLIIIGLFLMLRMR